MDLRVAELVGDVLQTGFQRQTTGTLEHLFGDVYTQNTPGRCGARRVTRGLPCSTPDVQHSIGRCNIGGRAQVLVVAAKLGVIVIGNREYRHAPDCTTIR